MAEDNDREQQEETPTGDFTSGNGKWRDDARQWYEELKGDEFTIAPWLSFEWTGERMRVRRG